MTRILYLASVDLPHRKARAIQIVNTAHALARAGADVTLVGGRRGRGNVRQTLEPFGLQPHPRLKLIRVPILRPPPSLDHWYTRAWQASYLVGVAAALPGLSAHGLPDTIMVRDLRLAWLLCKLGPDIQRRLVYEAHDLSALEAELRGEPAEAERLHRMEQTVFATSGHVVCITSALRRLIAERHGRPIQAMSVIADGTTAPVAGNDIREGKSGVYYVGQLYPWKGVDTLIQAVALDADLALTIVGGTEEPGVPDHDAERLAALARSLGCERRVRFLGWQPYHRVGTILRDAAVTVIPLPDTPFGRYFTSPLKLFDYMAAASAIVASDLPSLRDVLQHESNALLVPPEDPEALAGAIHRLLADPNLANRLGLQARDDVARYTWEERAARLLESMSTPRIVH